MRSAERAVALVQVDVLIDLNLLSIAYRFSAIMTRLMTNFLQSVKQMKFEGDDLKEGFKCKKIYMKSWDLCSVSFFLDNSKWNF